MSASVGIAAVHSPAGIIKQDIDGSEAVAKTPNGGSYKGFVAGVFSGIAKLSVG